MAKSKIKKSLYQWLGEFDAAFPFWGEHEDFDQDSFRFPFYVNSDGQVTMTPSTLRDRLVLERAFLALVSGETTDERICMDVDDDELLFEGNLELLSKMLKSRGIEYMDHGVCGSPFDAELIETARSEGDIGMVADDISDYLDFRLSASGLCILEDWLFYGESGQLDNYVAFFVESEEVTDDGFQDVLNDYHEIAMWSGITLLEFCFCLLPLYGEWNGRKGYMLLGFWGMPASWYCGRVNLSSIDLCALGQCLLDFPAL